MDAKQWAERLDERRGLSWREHDELAALLRAEVQAQERLERAVALLREANWIADPDLFAEDDEAVDWEVGMEADRDALLAEHDKEGV